MTTYKLKKQFWEVVIYPDFYDEDEGDHGYAWAGEARSAEHAIKQACSECLDTNDVRDIYEIDPDTVPTSDLQIDQVATAKAWMELYMHGLNEQEIPPNGDDFNDLHDGVLAILSGRAAPAIKLTRKGR